MRGYWPRILESLTRLPIAKVASLPETSVRRKFILRRRDSLPVHNAHIEAPGPIAPIASAFQSGSTVILDLTDATLIDSMVLGAIAEARMELLGSGGRHRLAISVRPDTHVARVLAIGLDGLVEAYDNLDAAYLAAT